MIRSTYIKINDVYIIYVCSVNFDDYIINKDNIMIPKEKINLADVVDIIKTHKKYINKIIGINKDIVVVHDYDFGDYIIRQSYYYKQNIIRQDYISKIDVDKHYRYEEDNTKIRLSIGTIFKTYTKFNKCNKFIILENYVRDYPFKTDLIVYKCIPFNKNVFKHDPVYIINNDIKQIIKSPSKFIYKIIRKYYRY